MMELARRISSIETREDLAELVELLAEDLRQHPDAWHNRDLLSFLTAAAAWIRDMDGHEGGGDRALAPQWRALAEILAAARVYE